MKISKDDDNDHGDDDDNYDDHDDDNELDDEDQICNSSANFQARSSIFCMVVHIDILQDFLLKKWPPKKKMAAKTQN